MRQPAKLDLCASSLLDSPMDSLLAVIVQIHTGSASRGRQPQTIWGRLHSAHVCGPVWARNASESVVLNKHIQRQTERRSSSRARSHLVATDPLSNQTPLRHGAAWGASSSPRARLRSSSSPHLVRAALLTNPALRSREPGVCILPQSFFFGGSIAFHTNTITLFALLPAYIHIHSVHTTT